MAAKKIRRMAGVSRIDQPERRTHGFFVRLRRKGKLYSGFFPDLKHGGKQRALTAAQRYYRELVKKYPPFSRRQWAQIPRRKGASGIVGVRKVVTSVRGRKRVRWQAMWSPEPHVLATRSFSVQKYGPQRAKALAIQARNAGLRKMKG